MQKIKEIESVLLGRTLPRAKEEKNVVISGIFPVPLAISHGIPFLFFAAMMVLQFFVVLFFIRRPRVLP
jgi:hypothetical protein